MSRSVRSDTADRLEHAVARVQSTSRQPSLVVGVVRDGELAWATTRGTATGGPEPGTDLQYRIGSITKSVTALTLLQCRDDGLVDLADSLGSVLGDVPFGEAPLRQLLSHTAGLPAEPAGPWWERRDGEDFPGLAELVRDHDRVLPPGGLHHYSNLGFALVGQAVAHLRGQPWFDVVRERVLEPLGMGRTSYAPVHPHAQGYSVHPWARTLDPEPHTDTGAMAPAGQLWSTLGDLARFARFWLQPDEAVLRAGSVAEMRVPLAAQPDRLEASYGLGLALVGHPGRTLFGHGGSMPGFLAGVAVDPQQGTAAAALSNGTAGDTPGLVLTLLDIVAELEPEPPPPWRPERPLAGAGELLGPWFWGDTPYTLVVRDGQLALETSNPGRCSRFVPAGGDRWHGLDGYFTAETLAAVRGPDGRVLSLELASYELTRTPYPH